MNIYINEKRQLSSIHSLIRTRTNNLYFYDVLKLAQIKKI